MSGYVIRTNWARDVVGGDFGAGLVLIVLPSVGLYCGMERISDLIGRSGHIVVVPELEELRTRRDAAGEVIAPLQLQPSVKDFHLGTDKPGR
jgi:hypothetical protein